MHLLWLDTHMTHVGVCIYSDLISKAAGLSSKATVIMMQCIAITCLLSVVGDLKWSLVPFSNYNWCNLNQPLPAKWEAWNEPRQNGEEYRRHKNRIQLISFNKTKEVTWPEEDIFLLHSDGQCAIIPKFTWLPIFEYQEFYHIHVRRSRISVDSASDDFIPGLINLWPEWLHIWNFESASAHNKIKTRILKPNIIDTYNRKKDCFWKR